MAEKVATAQEERSAVWEEFDKSKEVFNNALCAASWAQDEERDIKRKEAAAVATKEKARIIERIEMLAVARAEIAACDKKSKRNKAIATVERVLKERTDAIEQANRSIADANKVYSFLKHLNQNMLVKSICADAPKLNYFYTITEYELVCKSLPMASSFAGSLSIDQLQLKTALGVSCKLCENEEDRNMYKITCEGGNTDLFARSKWMCSECLLLVCNSGAVRDFSGTRDKVLANQKT